MSEMDKIIAALEQMEAEQRKADELAARSFGPLHEKPKNAANEPASPPRDAAAAVDLNALAVAPGGTGTIAGKVVLHRPREAPSDHEAKTAQGRMWLVSFTDLFSLMLCFFLMLYSMKDPTSINAPVLAGAFVENMRGGTGSEHAGTQEGQNISRTNFGEGLNLDYLQGILKAAVTQVNLQKDVKIAAGKDHLRLLVDEDRAFDGNMLSADGQRIAKGLANRLATLSNRITVVGVPSDSGDWAGALTRASAFSGLMRDAGYRKNFAVIAVGDGNPAGIEIRVSGDDGNMQ